MDSLTPGLAQWGTVWLPLPHLLMALFVWNMAWWRSGVAGSIPSLAAFVLATWLLHRIARRHWGTGVAAWAAMVFCLNPSLLYLAAVPMTETIYLAAFLGLIDQCSQYAKQPRLRHACGAGLFGLAGTLCRYDGWFVLPFALAAIIVASRGARQAFGAGWRFCLISGLGPAFWLLYNLYYFKNALAFAIGPGSARQIYLNALRHGGSPYPGDHSIVVAAFMYLEAVTLSCGVPLMILAAFGLLMWQVWRRHSAAWLLMLPLVWYLWAMWSGNVPIFVPTYWPHGYYNLRYGVQLLPAVALLSGLAVTAFACAAGRLALPRGWPKASAGVVLGLTILAGGAYLRMLSPPGPPAYAEAVRNSPGRLAMEHALAGALASCPQSARILMYYGSYQGALADDGIPLRRVVNEANWMLWHTDLSAPHLYVGCVVVDHPGLVDQLVNHQDLSQYFQKIADLTAQDQPEVMVYRRRER